MFGNKKLPTNINHWKVEYDQNGFLNDENWLITAEKTEDILQLTNIFQKEIIIDVGFYSEIYKIYVIYNFDWENPKVVFESVNTDLIEQKLNELICTYSYSKN